MHIQKDSISIRAEPRDILVKILGDSVKRLLRHKRQGQGNLVQKKRADFGTTRQENW